MMLDYGPDAILMAGLDGRNWRLKDLRREMVIKVFGRFFPKKFLVKILLRR